MSQDGLYSFLGSSLNFWHIIVRKHLWIWHNAGPLTTDAGLLRIENMFLIKVSNQMTNTNIFIMALFHSMILNCTRLIFFFCPSDFPPCELWSLMRAHLFRHTAFIAADSLSDPITPKMWWWKVAALCINKVLFMSYQSENSLTDVNVICTLLWPKTARSSPPCHWQRSSISHTALGSLLL